MSHRQVRVEEKLSVGNGTRKVQENRYDAENLRFELLEDGRCTSFVYHNGELLHEEGREGVQTSFCLGVGTDAFQRGREVYYIHQDEQLGTAIVTGRDGVALNSYRYDAFGNGLESLEQAPNRIRYTGQQFDELTGQYYLRARYYNPVSGRFTQEDVYQGDGLNLYAYCGNNPVVYYDSSGYAATDMMNSDDCPPEGGFGGDGNGDGRESDNQNGLDDVISLMQEGEITEDGRNIITHLDDGATVIFRWDVGDNAHAIESQGYPNPVDHVNIEIQTPTPRGVNKIRWDFHIILNDLGEVLRTFITGPWSDK